MIERPKDQHRKPPAQTGHSSDSPTLAAPGVDREPVLFSFGSRQNVFLSNFYEAPLKINGEIWKTVEHFYQASKFSHPDIIQRIRDAATPMEAKVLGASRVYPVRGDWNEYRLDVMRLGVLAKFRQNADLRDKLLQTGSRMLVEATADPFWGRGRDGKGLNHLGRILMEVRSALQVEVHEHTDQEGRNPKEGKMADPLSSIVGPFVGSFITTASQEFLRRVEHGDMAEALLRNFFDQCVGVIESFELHSAQHNVLEGGTKSSRVSIVTNQANGLVAGDTSRSWFNCHLEGDGISGDFSARIQWNSGQANRLRFSIYSGGEQVQFNCEYDSSEELKVSFTSKQGTDLEGKDLGLSMADGCEMLNARIKGMVEAFAAVQKRDGAS